jgi:uncharacterized protein (TIGR02246 family)
MRPISTRMALFSAAAALAVTSLPAHAAGPQRSTVAAIKAENARWADAFKRGDYHAIGRLYTEDGTLLQPGGGRVTGRAAIAEYFAKGYAGKKPDTVTFGNYEFYGNEQVVTEVSSSTIRNHAGRLTSRGKQTLIFLKQGGAWKLHRDIWNDDGPLTSGDR